VVTAPVEGFTLKAYTSNDEVKPGIVFAMITEGKEEPAVNIESKSCGLTVQVTKLIGWFWRG
jgi:hypothetical protein